MFVACSTFGAANGSALSSGRYSTLDCIPLDDRVVKCNHMCEMSILYSTDCIFYCRIFYAASRNGELPKFMAMIHNSRFTPVPGLLAQVS